MKRRALTAMGWSGADILVRNGLQFLVTIVLARLIAPEDFGTVAMLFLFIGLAGVMVDGGLSTALIQRQDIDHADESTVFWFNVGVGLLMVGLLGLVATPIATYFNHPVLAPLLLVGALTVFFSALGAVHIALLVKRLDFFTLLKAGGAAAVFSGSIAITLAVKGYGVWALAAQMISMACLNTCFLWMLNRWRPLARFSRNSLRKLLGFGGFVLAANVVDTFYNRAYTVLIGRYIGVGELGYYDRAEYARQLPAGLLSGIVARVALPIFSENAHDPVLLRSGFRAAIRGMMLVNLPVMLGLAAMAGPLIFTIFGDAWGPAVVPFQILCIAGAFWPLHLLNINILLAQGKAKLVLLLEIPKKIVGVSLLAFGVQFGIEGVAWSQVAFSIFAFFINGHFSAKSIGHGALAQVRDVWSTAVLAAFMAGIVGALSMKLSMAAPLKLGILAIVGVAFFVLASWMLNLRALNDALDLLRRHKPGSAMEIVS